MGVPGVDVLVYWNGCTWGRCTGMGVPGVGVLVWVYLG